MGIGELLPVISWTTSPSCGRRRRPGHPAAGHHSVPLPPVISPTRCSRAETLVRQDGDVPDLPLPATSQTSYSCRALSAAYDLPTCSFPMSYMCCGFWYMIVVYRNVGFMAQQRSDSRFSQALDAPLEPATGLLCRRCGRRPVVVSLAGGKTPLCVTPTH